MIGAVLAAACVCLSVSFVPAATTVGITQKSNMQDTPTTSIHGESACPAGDVVHALVRLGQVGCLDGRAPLSAPNRVRAATWHVDGKVSRVRWTPPTGFDRRRSATANFVKGYRIHILPGRVMQIDNPFRVEAALNRTTFPAGFPKVSVLTIGELEVGQPIEGPATAAQRIDGPIRWISMGDSYAAGDAADGVYAESLTGLPSTYGTTNRGDNPCWRSTGAWSPQLVERFGGAAYIDFNAESAKGESSDHIACAGETASGVLFEQLPKLDATVDMVTLMIGGNDIGFGTYILDCAVHFRQPKGQDCDPRKPAKGHLDVDHVDERVEAVVRAIRLRAPKAQVVVGTYPAILQPSAQIDQRHYHLGRVFFDTKQSGVSFTQTAARQFAGELQTELNAAITAGASRGGAVVVDMTEATTDHWLNVAEQWGEHESWIEPVRLYLFEDLSRAVEGHIESLHPRIKAQVRMADLAAAVLNHVSLGSSSKSPIHLAARASGDVANTTIRLDPALVPDPLINPSGSAWIEEYLDGRWMRRTELNVSRPARDMPWAVATVRGLGRGVFRVRAVNATLNAETTLRFTHGSTKGFYTSVDDWYIRGTPAEPSPEDRGVITLGACESLDLHIWAPVGHDVFVYSRGGGYFGSNGDRDYIYAGVYFEAAGWKTLTTGLEDCANVRPGRYPMMMGSFNDNRVIDLWLDVY